MQYPNVFFVPGMHAGRACMPDYAVLFYYGMHLVTSPYVCPASLLYRAYDCVYVAWW